MFGIFAWVAWIPILHNLYCALGAVLFGIYLVIDTQLIVGGGRYSISMDDYVAGALILYIDIIQIFLYILSLLGNNWIIDLGKYDFGDKSFIVAFFISLKVCTQFLIMKPFLTKFFKIKILQITHYDNKIYSLDLYFSKNSFTLNIHVKKNLKI